LITAEELYLLIKGCSLNQRESQKKLYHSFYGYAMAVCGRYTAKEADAAEILNDGFLKVFKEIHHFKPAYSDALSSFKGWLRKIMVFTAIDHFRKYNKHQRNAELETAVIHMPAETVSATDKISYDEIIRFIQELSPAYRTVLNLFIVDGFTHEEIAKELGISVGTSKSNLAKARKQLQKILYHKNKTSLAKNAG
jgi:RNA polymerase sigma factor (sigma-70 family)